MWNDYLYMETPDNFLVSLDAKTGKERWNKEHRATSASSTSRRWRRSSIGNHVIVGTGNDLDSPGFLQSFDPGDAASCSGSFYTVPMKAGDPGLDTWPSLEAARHGGGAAVAAGRLRSRDEALHLRHRQPDPAYTAGPRRRRQPLHVLARRRQRRHRQDGVVLPDVAARHARLGLGADADPVRRRRQRQARGSWCRPRRATATSSRSIASTGEHLVTTKYGIATNWVKSIDKKGSLRRDPGQGPDRSAARSSRRPPAARSTGSRRPTRRTPACSTSPSATASRSST